MADIEDGEVSDDDIMTTSASFTSNTVIIVNETISMYGFILKYLLIVVLYSFLQQYLGILKTHASRTVLCCTTDYTCECVCRLETVISHSFVIWLFLYAYVGIMSPTLMNDGYFCQEHIVKYGEHPGTFNVDNAWIHHVHDHHHGHGYLVHLK